MGTQSLVVFYMNGCPHCKAVTGPQSVCREGLDDLVDLYEIEASDSLTRAVGVTSFPTIVLVNPLFAFAFEGARESEAIREFVLRKMALTTAYLDAHGV